MPGRADTADRLVSVAREILAREGIEGLSLRHVAREAGVSHGAPLRHFPSFAALRAEVAGRGFQLLEEAIEKAAAQLPAGSHPIDRLQAAGRAYVAAAVENPGLFALMFRPELLDATQPTYAAHAPAAFAQLVNAVRAAQDAGFRPEADTVTLAGVVWSLVHGVATLWSGGALGHITEASLDSILDASFGSLLNPDPLAPAS